MSQKKFKKYAIKHNYITNHPHVLIRDLGKDYKSVGITHAPITTGIKNTPLKKNIDSKDKKKNYFLANPSVYKKKFYGPTNRPYSLSSKDKKEAARIGSKSKIFNKKKRQ